MSSLSTATDLLLIDDPPVFSSGFSEAAIKNMNAGFPVDEKPHLENYDYETDSDLDESIPAVETALSHLERPGRVIILRDAAFLT